MKRSHNQAFLNNLGYGFCLFLGSIRLWKSHHIG